MKHLAFIIIFLFLSKLIPTVLAGVGSIEYDELKSQIETIAKTNDLIDEHLVAQIKRLMGQSDLLILEFKRLLNESDNDRVSSLTLNLLSTVSLENRKKVLSIAMEFLRKHPSSEMPFAVESAVMLLGLNPSQNQGILTVAAKHLNDPNRAVAMAAARSLQNMKSKAAEQELRLFRDKHIFGSTDEEQSLQRAVDGAIREMETKADQKSQQK